MNGICRPPPVVFAQGNQLRATQLARHALTNDLLPWGLGDRLWPASSASGGALNSAICYAQLRTTQSRSHQLKLDSPIGPKLWTLGGKRPLVLRNSARISKLFDMSSHLQRKPATAPTLAYP